jgi:hypothetical protein
MKRFVMVGPRRNERGSNRDGMVGIQIEWIGSKRTAGFYMLTAVELMHVVGVAL